LRFDCSHHHVSDIIHMNFIYHNNTSYFILFNFSRYHSTTYYRRISAL
jgi:hypothetical protein